MYKYLFEKAELEFWSIVDGYKTGSGKWESSTAFCFNIFFAYTFQLLITPDSLTHQGLKHFFNSDFREFWICYLQ